MTKLLSAALNQANSLLKAGGVKLMRHHSLYRWQITSKDGLCEPFRTDEGPSANDPRLKELEDRYRTFDPQVTTPFEWPAGTVTADHFRNFRGDNPYVWQRIGLNANDVAYALTYYSLKSRRLGRMTEDGAFGVRTLKVDGRLVSRDLLDSVTEIDFLTRHLGPRFSILDIGAGYGRLAHRLSESTDAVIYTTDALAASTFLSEFYLTYRNAKARVVPLDEFESFIQTNHVDIATNIHSFSECRIEAIDWWVARLSSAGVRYLMVVPNTGLERCITNEGKDMEAVFARHGYELLVREPRHRDPIVQRYGVDPSHFNLFIHR